MDGMAPRDDKKKSGLGCGVCPVVVVVAEGFVEVAGVGVTVSRCERMPPSGARTLIDFPTPPISPRVLASKVYTPI